VPALPLTLKNPTLPEYTPRAPGSSVSITSMVRNLGALAVAAK
jgi:hypothetical protein